MCLRNISLISNATGIFDLERKFQSLHEHFFSVLLEKKFKLGKNAHAGYNRWGEGYITNAIQKTAPNLHVKQEILALADQ